MPLINCNMREYRRREGRNFLMGPNEVTYTSTALKFKIS